jgi:Family of unknown function (DUF5331)
MAFFYSFTESLKQKWLQFFQANHDWIMLHMQVESVYTPDGGKRPPSYLILGVVNALEPKLAQLMLPFSRLNPDADTLIEVLGLHFDPNMVLGHSGMPNAEDNMVMGESDAATTTQPNAFSDATGSNFTVSNFAMTDAIASDLMVDEVLKNHSVAEIATHGIAQPNMVEEPRNGFGGLSDISSASTESPDMSGLDGMNAFSDDVSFDASTSSQEKFDFQGLEDINASDEEHGFGDVLMDVWSEEGQAKKGQADNEMSLGDDFSSAAFDDSEIARLFPNA